MSRASLAGSAPFIQGRQGAGEFTFTTGDILLDGLASIREDVRRTYSGLALTVVLVKRDGKWQARHAHQPVAFQDHEPDHTSPTGEGAMSMRITTLTAPATTLLATSLAAQTATTTAPAAPPPSLKSLGPIVYPAKGQTPEQQSKKAAGACLSGRGDTVS